MEAQLDYRDCYDKAMAMLLPKRRPHVDGCIGEALRLAEYWGADTRRACLAALLHDITKSKSAEEQLKLCETYGIILRIIDKKTEKVLHAVTGAAMARDLFGIDGETQSAIRWHTTGRAGMTLLEKVIFLADYIEPTRDFDGVEEVRALAYVDLNRAMFTALRNTIAEVCAKPDPISPETIDAYNDCLIAQADKIQ